MNKHEIKAINRNFSTIIRKSRKSKNLRFIDLERMTGISALTIKKIETAPCKSPVASLIKLLVALQLNNCCACVSSNKVLIKQLGRKA